nr:unnamed protein product [Expression vector pLEAD5]
MTMITDIRRIT